ncbi:MAG: LamG domain-containing protein, partial [Patescibacteria group bacterium]|nr:LamG domain-containing protein [Patescibacteria group bacterium]
MPVSRARSVKKIYINIVIVAIIVIVVAIAATVYNFASKQLAKVSLNQQVAAVEGADSGLVDWWKMDDGAGAIAADSAGSNNLNLSDTSWSVGKIGGALTFGQNDSRATTSSDLIGTGDATVCAWYNTTSTAAGPLLLSDSRFSIGLSISNTFQVSNDGTQGLFSAIDSVSANSWNHICVTRASSGLDTIYINGIQSSSGTPGTPTTGVNLTVGGHPWLGGQEWSGSLDDVRIYNRILSSAEVASIYAEGGGAVYSLTLNNQNPSHGSVSSNPSGINCGSTCSIPSIQLGSSITLTAAAGSGYSPQWSGCGSTVGGNTCTVTINGNTNVNVNFIQSGGTVTAASCNNTDVQTAINQVTNGGTVLVPAGTCHWTNTVTIDVSANPRSIILKGAGSQSVMGGGDQTIIIDDNQPSQSSYPQDNPLLAYTGVSGVSFRLTGFTFRGGTAPMDYEPRVRIGGNTDSVRVDHNHFDNLNGAALGDDSAIGVADHNVFDQPSGSLNNQIRVTADSWQGIGGMGDNSWAQPPDFGTTKAFYAEDNIF